MKTVELEGAAQSAREVKDEVARSPWIGRLARLGLVAKGISYGLVGALAIALAVGGAGKATSREGALNLLSDESYGLVILFGLGVGFAAYALWRAAQAFLDREREGTDAPGLAKRAGYLGRAAIYAVLSWSAFALLDGTGSDESQTQEARQATAQILDWPAGRWLVGGVGLAFVAAALFNAYRAFTQKFEEKWYVDDLTSRQRQWLAGASSVGLLARFVVFGLIGVFLLRAAYQYDPQEAIGLDGALQKVVQASYGPVLLAIVAAGLLFYALFCLAEARYRRV